jgi:enamine deaminase RidA (YjgF/YER057c/UK114 family)
LDEWFYINIYMFNPCGGKIMDITRLDPGVRFCQATVFNQTMYISGQVAADSTADIRNQTDQILKQIEALLVRGGSSKEHILFANIWLSDMADFAAMNEVWDSWVSRAHMPARATVEAKLANPNFKVEISCIAACK